MASLQEVVRFALLALPLAALCSFVVTGLAVRHARRRRWLAHPEERSSHSVPTPQVGGIGVCAALLAGLAFLAIPQLRALVPGSGAGPLPMALGWLLATVAFGLALGLWDDLHPLSALPKLVAVIALAALGTVATWYLSKDGNYWNATVFIVTAASDYPEATFIGCVVLVFVWIFFFINAFNFMDGVNGQSGVFGLNALAWLLLIATRGVTKGDPQASAGTAHFLSLTSVWWPGVLLAGGLIGFLPWNFPRARTFLGDCGSLSVGALLAILLLALEGLGNANFVSGLFVLSPYIYDVIFTLIRRELRGEKIWTAHRSHLYQRLLIATGWSHPRLLAYHLPYWAMAGLLALIWQLLTRSFPVALDRLLLLPLGLGVLLAGYTVLVWKAEARRASDTNRAAQPADTSASREDSL